MITKDNLVEVLKHNGIDPNHYVIYPLADTIKCYMRDFNSGKLHASIIHFDNPLWLKLIEIYFGELEPLPEPNPFNVVYFGEWVKCIKNEFNVKYLTVGKWYQRLKTFEYKHFAYIGNDNYEWHSSNPKEWDLTDIRDYNPDEEIILKVGDEIHFYNDLKYLISEIDHIRGTIYLGERKSIAFKFGENHKIKSVNGKQGKYKIPEFDFEQTLLNAGFVKDDNIIYGKLLNLIVGTNKFYHAYSTTNLALSPANAERLIKATAILNELELAE